MLVGLSDPTCHCWDEEGHERCELTTTNSDLYKQERCNLHIITSTESNLITWIKIQPSLLLCSSRSRKTHQQIHCHKVHFSNQQCKDIPKLSVPSHQLTAQANNCFNDTLSAMKYTIVIHKYISTIQKQKNGSYLIGILIIRHSLCALKNKKPSSVIRTLMPNRLMSLQKKQHISLAKLMA
jgi:hypothetical protein